MNDPLLQTLMEADRILSRSKKRLAFPSHDTPAHNISEHPSETSDNSSQDSLDKREPSESSISEKSLPCRESGVSSLPGNIVPVDEKEILQNRLSLEQIKEIPKFAGYSPGEPNKVSLPGRRRDMECPYSLLLRLWNFIECKKKERKTRHS